MSHYHNAKIKTGLRCHLKNQFTFSKLENIFFTFLLRAASILHNVLYPFVFMPVRILFSHQNLRWERRATWCFSGGKDAYFCIVLPRILSGSRKPLQLYFIVHISNRKKKMGNCFPKGVMNMYQSSQRRILPAAKQIFHMYTIGESTCIQFLRKQKYSVFIMAVQMSS